jgi:predicted transcriptional regulator
VPYPPRPQLQPLPEFAGTAAAGRFLDRDLRQRLETYIVTAYTQGRSLREIAELVDRTPTAVWRVLDAHQVPRRAAGAARTAARRR